MDLVVTVKCVKESFFPHTFKSSGGELTVLYVSDQHLYKHELIEKYYGVDKYWVLLPKNNKHLTEINFEHYL